MPPEYLIWNESIDSSVKEDFKSPLWDSLTLQREVSWELWNIWADLLEGLLSEISNEDIQAAEELAVSSWLKIVIFDNMKEPANLHNAQNLLQNIEYLSRKIFEYVDGSIWTNSTHGQRKAWLITHMLISNWFFNAGHTVLEESEHNNTSVSYWYDSEIIIRHETTWNIMKSNMTIYDLFFYKLSWRSWRAGASYSYGDIWYDLEKSTHITWAWINSHTDYSIDFMKNTIRNWWHHVTDMTPYYTAKMYGLLYYYTNLNWEDSSWDPNQYVAKLKEQWVEVSVDELFKYSILAVLISGWSLSSINAGKRYISDGSYTSDNIWFEIGDTFISFPEFNLFLRKNGISARADVFLKYHQDSQDGYHIWFESSIEWNVSTELTLWRFWTIWETTSYDLWISLNDIWWIYSEASVTHLITSRAWLYAQADYSNGFNNNGFGEEQYNIYGWITFRF